MQSEVMRATEEIISFLHFGDYGLAIRRVLDLAYETGNKDFLRKTLRLSRQFNMGEGITNQGLTDDVKAVLNKYGGSIKESAPDAKLLVKATNISKKYESSSFYLQPMNLELSSGEILGVVGENGHGKTTLLRCIAGQLALSSGHIDYPGISSRDYYSIKNYVVFMPQRIPRWFGFLKDNLHFAASISGHYGDENELIVDFMIERLGLTKFRDLTWDEISSGYRTRFELARILLNKPRLLILDEPLANLDINAQQTILTDLRSIAKSAYNPMGVLLSSQQLYEVEKVADEVVFIKNGISHYRSVSNSGDSNSVVIEIETKASRSELEQTIGNLGVSIKYNGGIYLIESNSASSEQLLRELFNAGITISYFRDITHSTKRYF